MVEKDEVSSLEQLCEDCAGGGQRKDVAERGRGLSIMGIQSRRQDHQALT